MISKRQKEILDYLVRYIEKKGYSPSLGEIADKMDLSSLSTIHHHLSRLEEEGFILRQVNKPRSIHVSNITPTELLLMKKQGMDSVRVPVLGSANAGPANLLADENVEGYLKVSERVLRNRKKVFALRVQGDSMNNAKMDGKNIEEGDYVLIDPEYKNPRNGDYVLSILDGCANIKKFQINSEKRYIALISESTNSRYKPIYVSSKDNFMINGKIIDVIKK